VDRFSDDCLLAFPLMFEVYLTVIFPPIATHIAMTLLRPKSGIYFGGVYFFHSLLTPLPSLCLLYFPFLYRSLSLRHLAAPLNQIMGLGSAVHSSSGVRPGRKRIFGVFRAQETRLVAAFY